MFGRNHHNKQREVNMLGKKYPDDHGYPDKPRINDKNKLIVEILDDELTANWTDKQKAVTVGDLMTLGGWVTPSVGVREEVERLTIKELSSMAKALSLHMKTNYNEGAPCCCCCT